MMVRVLSYLTLQMSKIPLIQPLRLLPHQHHRTLNLSVL